MTSSSTARLGLAGLLAMSACTDDGGVGTIEAPPDAGCLRDETPRLYEVYFVVDVSGSMAPYIEGLAAQLENFARAFPEVDDQDVRVMVDYYVVGFVNDFRWFPSYQGRRMSSAVAVQAALADAIAAGSTNKNLTQNYVNAEPEENLLDALAQVIAHRTPGDPSALLVVIATDADFVEAPTVLSYQLPVQSTYATIFADLSARNARVHAFSAGEVDGLTRPFRGTPALTTLPGSGAYDMFDLTRSDARIRDILGNIARGAACN